MKKSEIESLYEQMLRIRLFEEAIGKLCDQGKLDTPCHLYIGQEAIAVGVCSALTKDDYIVSTHRSHGHYLAKGGDMKRLATEILGKKEGCSKGRGGSMNVADKSVGHYGSSAIVGGSIPIAVGLAFAQKLNKTGHIAVCFFGDGACDEGVFYESVNFAVLNNVPVLFVLENNGYSSHLPIAEHIPTILSAAHHATVDGNNVEAINDFVKSKYKSISEGTPFLLECMTYRQRGHVGNHDDLNMGLRSKDELERWLERDPLKQIHIEDKSTIREQVETEVQEALRYAENLQ